VSNVVLHLSFESKTGTDRRAVVVDHAVIAGWTGRDTAALEKHIKELEELGVKRPAMTPIFYRIAARRLTTDDAIEVLGAKSGGEVEFVLLQSGDRLWVGVGSDHTDREVEAYGVTVSKQMCDKPIGTTFWPMSEVAAHWDRLVLRSHVYENGREVLYQEGLASAMRAPDDLIRRYRGGDRLSNGTLMFGGTLAAKGGVRATTAITLELEDPVLGRRLRHRYRSVSLPIAG